MEIELVIARASRNMKDERMDSAEVGECTLAFFSFMLNRFDLLSMLWKCDTRVRGASYSLLNGNCSNLLIGNLFFLSLSQTGSTYPSLSFSIDSAADRFSVPAPVLTANR